MKDLLGSPGTVTGLLLRFGQSLFAASSIGVMVSALGFANFTAYCYLIASMGLQALWSFGLACLDIYALWIKKDLRNPVLVSLFVVGDWIVIHISFIQRMRFGISRTVALYLSAISETKLPFYSSRYFIYEDITLVASACSGRTIYIAVGLFIYNFSVLPLLWLTVTATLSLAAACSSAGIAVLYAKDLKFCTGPSHLPCDRFELSIALAFVTWSLIAISSHVMFWVLASV